MPDAEPPEILVCDTSFVSHLAALRLKPRRYEHWDDSLLDRVNDAILAISVITVAEVRSGHINANWGAKRVAESERRLNSYLQIPLDFPDLDEWARLRNVAIRRGVHASDNDLWIASTASARGHPLVSCDNDHANLDSHLPVDVIYFPPPRR